MPQAQDTGRKIGNERAPLPAFLAENRILDVFQVAELIGYSVAHTRRLYRTGKIPAPISIGGRKKGWTVAVARKLTEVA